MKKKVKKTKKKKLIVCPICNKKYKSQVPYDKHLRTHVYIEPIPSGTTQLTRSNQMNKKDDVINHLCYLKISQKVPYSDLVIMLQKAPYFLPRRSTYTYLKEVKKKIMNVYDNWHIGALEEALADLDAQKLEAKTANDRRLILDITKEENRLKGLYVEKIKVDGDIKNTIKIEPYFYENPST